MWLRLSVTYNEPDIHKLQKKIGVQQFAELCVLWSKEPWLPFAALVKFVATLFPSLKGKREGDTIADIKTEISEWQKAKEMIDARKNNGIHKR